MTHAQSEQESRFNIGLLHAIGAYTIWGFVPLFFKQLEMITPVEVVAHRIIWSLLMLLGIVWLRGRRAELYAVFANRRLVATLALSALLIAANWLIYIWAIFQDMILAASLGYYLNPLFNIILGMVFLKEKLRPIQWFCVALAGVGVAILASQSLSTIWISVVLALTFGFYGLVRKQVAIGSFMGLTVETILLFLPALAYAIWAIYNDDAPGWGYSHYTDMFMILGGVVTATPLLLFASAARKMSLTTLGFIQYIGPTLQFLLAVLYFGETFTTAHMWCFGFIWLALIIFSADSWNNTTKRKKAAA